MTTAICAHVFQAAADLGLGQLIYASSTQVFSGNRQGRDTDRPSCLPYLPLDGHVRPHPINTYAAGKEAGEALLRYHARIGPHLACTTLRFPLLVSTEQVTWYRDQMPAAEPEPDKLLAWVLPCWPIVTEPNWSGASSSTGCRAITPIWSPQRRTTSAGPFRASSIASIPMSRCAFRAPG